MFRNYLITAWRNLQRHRVHSSINILGLSVGMAVAMIVGLWTWDELSFDRSNSNYRHIAMVMQNTTDNGAIRTGDNLPYLLGDELRKDYGNDFKYVVAATRPTKTILTNDDKLLSQNGAYFQEQAPDLLDLKMLAGSRHGLKEPNSILLSQSAATAYFGGEDPMNKVMKLDNKMSVKVTGVYADFPNNSSFANLNFMAPWELMVNSQGLRNMPDPWRRNSWLVYVQLGSNTELNAVSARIRDVKLRRVSEANAKYNPRLFLYPMSRWRLYSDFKDGVNTGGRIQYVWLFGTIGVIVLLMACINFMNLSTASSARRAKEVGVRKAVGSLRVQLISQFFCESILIAGFAFMFSLVWVLLLLPFFNQVASKQLGILWDQPVFWMVGIGFTIFTGLIAGSYPALYLSSFRPTRVLKGAMKAGPNESLPRKILVVLQFSASVILIIGTIIVFRQIEYAQSRPMGYDRSGLVVVPTSFSHSRFEVIKNELIQGGSITEMAESGNSITGIRSTNSGFEWRGKSPGLADGFPTPEVSIEYGRTVGWQFVAGRDFSTQFRTDSTAFVINEAAVKVMGLQNPVRETIMWDGKPFTVIGVIKDMIVESPYEQVRPAIYHLTNDSTDFGFAILRINPQSSAHEAIAKIAAAFKKYDSEEPFEYRFADDEFNRKFGDEERVGKLAGFSTLLAIVISCLGLFGMASFMAEQRVKEIGIRKLLGASVINLWGLLSKEFVLLVIISLVIAIPAAYYYMHKWLLGFYYRTDISWWIFALTAIAALLITLLTVSYHTIRAARMNPMRSLRSE
jgi:putative ABC transport system permease protein